jgi:MFS family permease
MKRNLSIILLITFFDFLSISVFFGTTIPLILAKQSLFPLIVSEHLRSIIYGLTLLILPIGQFLITPLWGQMSDQIGRKPILFITLLASALGFFLMGLAISAQVFTLFIIGRIITACVATNMAIGQASIADVSEGKKKTQRFNLQYIVVSLGFIVGPYLISYTSHDIHYANAYWVIAGGYVFAFLMIVMFFRETLKFASDDKIRWMMNVERIFAILKSGKLKRLFIIWMIFQLGWSLFFQYSGEFLFLQHHVTNDFINHLFSWAGAGIFAVQILLVQPLSHKIAPQKIVPWAVLLIGGSLFIMGFLPVNISFYVFLGVYCLGIGFFLTNMNTYVSNEAGSDQQGRAMAMLASSQSLMDIIVTLLGSFFVAYYLPTPFVIGGALILASLLVWWGCKNCQH